MDCEKAREGLWPPERPKLVGDDVAMARAHVDGCESCRDYFLVDRDLLECYRRAVRPAAPRGVRERVFDALARARWDEIVDGHDAAVKRTAGARRRTAKGVVLLTVASALGGLFVWSGPSFLERAAPADGPEVFVQDYLRRAVGQDHIVTTDAAEVRHFLQRELGVRFDPISHAGLVLQSAEICLLEGRRGAMIVYKKDGQTVSHYVVPRPEAGDRAPTVSTASDGTEMPVVTWSVRNLEQALVGEMESDELLRIAAWGEG